MTRCRVAPVREPSARPQPAGSIPTYRQTSSGSSSDAWRTASTRVPGKARPIQTRGPRTDIAPFVDVGLAHPAQDRLLGTPESESISDRIPAASV